MSDAKGKTSSAINPEAIWFMALRGAMSIPGIRVDRDSFLRNQFFMSYSETEMIESIIALGPPAAGVSKDAVEK